MLRSFAELHEALIGLADELRDRIPQLVEDGLATMRDELPEFFVRDRDPDFVETYRRSYHQQLRAIMDGLGGERVARAGSRPRSRSRRRGWRRPGASRSRP
jgi:hypothetical protein